MLISFLAAAAAGALVTASGGGGGQGSRITGVDITRVEPVGTFGGVPFRRIQGTIHGEVAASEAVAGLPDAASGRALAPYETTFELITPEDPARADGVVVEANNRGMGVIAALLSAPPAKRPAPPAASGGLLTAGQAATLGDGFIFAHRLSVARIQWQAGIAPGVPQAAQGVGEVIVRDFGRWLGGAFPAARGDLPVFKHRILAGASQSAWFVNSFIAEGFNEDPASGRGVYGGAFTRNGAGAVLAINRFADGGAQFPYVPPNARPLTPAELLSRPNSDPVLVDVTSLTDFYRVRASVFSRAAGKPGVHRYATGAPHAPGALVSSAYIFGTMRCNGGEAVPLSGVSDALYLRPLLLGLASAIGLESPEARPLPADAPFTLTPAPAELGFLNRLEGTPVWIPKSDADGVPIGGVQMLETTLPLGAPVPPALPPVGARSINDTCGNFSGWRVFTAEELTRRYGGRAGYLERARRQAAELVRAGYLLAEDEAAALAHVEAQLPVEFR
jgi:hypothetical protein